MKGLVLGVLIFGGDYTGTKICVSKSVRLILGEISAPSWEPYQTVSAVLIFHPRYFENGPLDRYFENGPLVRLRIYPPLFSSHWRISGGILEFYILEFNLKPRLLL